MASNTFMKALFKTPKYNVFPQDNEVKLSYEIGKLIPVQYWDLVPGDSIKTRIGQLTRFAPMLAPIFQRFKIDFHAIAIPHRLAIPMPVGNYTGYYDGFESFHNLSVSDEDRPVMPQMKMYEYANWLMREGINPIGTLFDFLGYPTFEKYYREFLAANVASTELNTSDITVDPELPGAYEVDNLLIGPDSIQQYILNYYKVLSCYYDGNYAWEGEIVEFTKVPDYHSMHELFEKFIDTEETYLGSAIFDGTNFKLDHIDAVYKAAGSKTIFDDLYMRAAYAVYLKYCLNENSLSAQPLSLLPIYSYWSAVYDWYINTNLEPNADKKDKWLHEEIGLPFTPFANESYGVDDSWIWDEANSTDLPSTVWTPFESYWTNDYFTSAFLHPQRGSDVSIPAAGTIADLRNANSLQEFMEKLMYSGKRAIDVVKTIFGVQSSDERLDRCQVIGSKSFSVNMSDVLQTSQTDIDSQLGQFAGQGISVGQDSFIDFQAEEHTLIMVFMRIRPNAIYEGRVNHLLFQVDPYDFLIPDFAQVGEQAILVDELFPQYSQGKVFGWTRRYAQYMETPSHVHGEFKTSLDYWHDARRFDNEPVLNVEFAKVTDKDDLNRIFTVPAAKEHVYSYLHFDTLISRPLPKYVQYTL